MRFYTVYDILHSKLIIELNGEKYTRIILNSEEVEYILNAIPLCVVEENVTKRNEQRKVLMIR